MTQLPSVKSASSDGTVGDHLEPSTRTSRATPQDIEALIREHGGRMLAVARRFFPREQDAQDALQDAFVSALTALDSFHGSSQLATWMHRIVVNACLMKLRSNSRRPTIPLQDLLPTFDETGHHAKPVRHWSEDPFQHVVNTELRHHIRECIDQLPDAFRTVLLLRDIEELDTEETAQILGVSTAVVKTRLHRARQALRTLLDPVFT